MAARTRCHARRSAFASSSSSAAIARCPRCRSRNVDCWWIAERTSGCLNTTTPCPAAISPLASASCRLAASIPSAVAGTEDQVEVGGVGGGREQQELLGARAQVCGAGGVQALDLAAHRERIGQRLAPRQLVVAQQGRELDDRQWVAGVVLDQPGLDLGGDHRRPVEEQRRRGLVVEPAQPVLRQPGGLEDRLVGVADREDHQHALGIEPARHEPQHVGRRGVEPLGVVHDAGDGGVPGQLAEERECGHPDQERVDAPATGQAQGAVQRLLVQPRQGRHHVDRRPEDLVQPREREVGLGGDTGAPEHLAATLGRLVVEPVHQRGLADAGLAAHHQRRTGPALGRGEQPRQYGAVVAAPVEHARHASGPGPAPTMTCAGR